MKSISPAKATEKQMIKIYRDNIDFDDFTIFVDPSLDIVYLSEHPLGEKPKQKIEIPRKYFNKLVNWYLKPQKLRF